MHTIPQRVRAKKTFLAAVLSLFLPGTGQIYCEQDNKGVFLLGMSLLGHWSTNGASSWLLFPMAALDAFAIAKKINETGIVGRWEFFPGIPGLSAIPPRIILVAITLWIAFWTVLNIRHFGADYPTPGT
jgi:hypothetical protein